MRRTEHKASIDKRGWCSKAINYAFSDSPSNVKPVSMFDHEGNWDAKILPSVDFMAHFVTFHAGIDKSAFMPSASSALAHKLLVVIQKSLA